MLTFTSEVKHDPPAMRQLSQHFVTTIMLASIPAFLGVAAVAPSLVLALFGEQWLESAHMLRVLSLGCVGIGLRYLFVPLIVALDTTKPIFIMQLVRFLLTNGLLFAGTFYGLIEALVAFTFGHIIADGLVILYLKRALMLSYLNWCRIICKPLIAAIIMFGIVMYMDSNLLWPLYAKLAVEIVCGVIIYITAYPLLFPKSFSELLLAVRQIIKRS